MAERSRYEGLEVEIRKEVVRYTLFHGVAGPLIFLWAIGLGLFLILWSSPLLAGIWTAAVLSLGFLMAASVFGDRKVLERCTRLAIERPIPLQRLGDLSSKAALQRGVELLGEIVIKTRAIERAWGTDVYLRRVVANARDMLLLQYEAATQSKGTGTETRSPGSEVVRELESISLVLDRFQGEGSRRDPALASQLARQAEETLVRLRAWDRLVALGPGPEDQFGEEPATLRGLRRTLQAGFSKIKSAEGLKALQQLADALGRLQPVLDRKKETDPLAVAQIPQLAEDLYHQGLNVLRDAMDLALAIQSPEKGRLESEVVRLEKEIAALQGNDNEAARLRMDKETLASHRSRLDTIKRYEVRVDELIHHCGRCEASLHQTRIELAALKVDGSEANIGSVTETLRKTIQQARDVQDEFKKLGP